MSSRLPGPVEFPMSAVDLRRLPWRDPLQCLAPHAETPFATLLLSDGGGEGRWSYLALAPERTATLLPGETQDAAEMLRGLLGPRAPAAEGGPPFQGGVIGLWAYELG